MKKIDKIALILISNDKDDAASHSGKLLVARSRGKDLFYIPGGKRDEGESDHDTLCREINEELDVSIIKETIEYASTFEAPADAKEDAVVRIACYYAQIKGSPRPCQEIEELKWVSLKEKSQCSLITQHIMDWLYKTNEIHI